MPLVGNQVASYSVHHMGQNKNIWQIGAPN